MSLISSNLYLAAQMAILPAAIVWLYRRSQRIYRKVRTTIIATWTSSRSSPTRFAQRQPGGSTP